jgi:riboflavin kinase/FMN adenylyltransferase
MGYPTANLQLDSRLALPAEGVYISEAAIVAAGGTAEEYLGPAVTAVSSRPTFHGNDLSIESYIIDYVGDLYGSRITVRFLQRLREIRRFPNCHALQAQIAADVQAAREFGKRVYNHRPPW